MRLPQSRCWRLEQKHDSLSLQQVFFYYLSWSNKPFLIPDSSISRLSHTQFYLYKVNIIQGKTVECLVHRATAYLPCTYKDHARLLNLLYYLTATALTPGQKPNIKSKPLPPSPMCPVIPYPKSLGHFPFLERELCLLGGALAALLDPLHNGIPPKHTSSWHQSSSLLRHPGAFSVRVACTWWRDGGAEDGWPAGASERQRLGLGDHRDIPWKLYTYLWPVVLKAVKSEMKILHTLLLII